MSSVDVTDLAWELAASGFAGREQAVREVVRAARAGGVPAALTAVLADAGEPEIARLRAFGRIAAMLSAPEAPGRVTRAA
jgi:hypothetical protein